MTRISSPAQCSQTTSVFLIKKALVWFQAEKTVPNPHVLAQSLTLEDFQFLFAD